MPLILTIEIVIIVFVFLLAIYKTIKSKLISVKYSIMWIAAAVLMLFAALTPNILKKIANLIGFELASNMLFLIGFLILFFMAFSLTVIVSIQKREITTLVQEVGLIKSQMQSNEQEG